MLGDPVAHSLSPVMHNAAIAALGLDAVYVALQVRHETLPAVLDALAMVGGAGNVTVPLKIAAANHLANLTPRARSLQAVNTFWHDDGQLQGDNTDIAGILASLEALEAQGPWLVAGTGGAARAVAGAAVERGVTLLIRSRTEAGAKRFAEWARGLGVDAHAEDGRPVATIINATPLGLRANDTPPVPPDRTAGAAAALDCVYATGGTRWVRTCRDQGLRAIDGSRLLVEQGAAAFERFFPGVVAPREIMRAAVARALG